MRSMLAASVPSLLRWYARGLLLVMALVLMQGAVAADLVLAERGKTSAYAIVLPSTVTETEQYAAQELRRWTEELTGVRLPVRLAKDNWKGPSVRILADDENLGLEEDGFNLRVVGDDVEIRGGLRGVIYGVYELLETYGGIDWLATDCTVIPKDGVLKVPDSLYDTQRPAFLLRETDWSRTLDPERQYAVIATNRDFGVRRRLNGEYNPRARSEQGGIAYRFVHGAGVAHTFLRLVPPKRYFQTHPEYYSEINGVRRNGETQLCLTNPEVLEVLVSNLVSAIDKDPTAPFYGVSQDDWFNFCECATCKAVDDAEGSHAGTMLRFVNAVASRIDALRPGRMCETLAYQYTREPPKITRPASNVVVCLCNIECDWSRPLVAGRPACNAAFVRDLTAWNRITDRLFAWDYSTNYKWTSHPFPNLTALQSNLRFFRDHGVRWIFEQGGGRYADFAALKCYLVSRWLWNPDLPSEPLLKTFFAGYYGAAAPYARACLDAYEAALANAPESDRQLRLFEGDRPTVYTAALQARCRDLWAKAEAAVQDDPLSLTHVRHGRALETSRRLDRAAAAAKFAWATRQPERFAKNAEMSADYRWILDWIAERRRTDPHHAVRFGGSETHEDVRITNDWARAVASVPPTRGGDVALLSADDLALEHDGTWAIRVADAAAAKGRAVKITPMQDRPSVYFNLAHLAFDADVPYEVRVRVRTDKVPGGKGEAFHALISDTEREIAPRVEDTGDGYEWHTLGTLSLAENQSLRIGCGRFKNGGGRNAVRAVYVDQVEFKRVR